jgi:hypothetical protein
MPTMTPEPILTRRQFLERSGMGLGGLALSTMLAEVFAPFGCAETNPLAPRPLHFPAKAKHVIHIFALGGPSQVDTWDPKPELTKNADKAIPGQDGVAFASPFGFHKMGQSGIEVSEVFPKLGEHVDEMAVVRSLWTEIPDHAIAQRFMHTGSPQLPKPSLGSWVLYGLGSGNANMPGFISLGGQPEWRQASFLPGVFQGVNVNYTPAMKLNQILLNIRSQFTPLEQQRKQIDLANRLNALQGARLHGEPQLGARIQSFEMAFKMQTEATDAFDISRETAATRALYTSQRPADMGVRGAGKPDELGMKLLVARRLVERGVRFVQIVHGSWDHHTDLERNLRQRANELDGPAAGLLADLKQRGLLDDTLVLWGGEFGRTVARDRNGNAGTGGGRDHNGHAACCWMAGGGVKPGTAYGATDEFGARAVQDKVHVHDLHATILALLGFDHEKLTFRYNGRDFRLTDNAGHVVKGVIA